LPEAWRVYVAAFVSTAPRNVSLVNYGHENQPEGSRRSSERLTVTGAVSSAWRVAFSLRPGLILLQT